MLVLSRKRDEQIVMELDDQTIRVRVISIDGNRVRLGIEADESVHIYRSELAKEHEMAR